MPDASTDADFDLSGLDEYTLHGLSRYRHSAAGDSRITNATYYRKQSTIADVLLKSGLLIDDENARMGIAHNILLQLAQRGEVVIGGGDLDILFWNKRHFDFMQERLDLLRRQRQPRGFLRALFRC